MKTPRCKKRGCGWRGNPTDDQDGAKSQIDEHNQTAHPNVVEITDLDSHQVDEQEV